MYFHEFVSEESVEEAESYTAYFKKKYMYMYVNAVPLVVVDALLTNMRVVLEEPFVLRSMTSGSFRTLCMMLLCVVHRKRLSGFVINGQH